MNKLTMDRIFENYNNLMDDIRRIGEYLYKLRYNKNCGLQDLDPYINHGCAEFTYKTYFRGEYDDSFEVSFPLEYLWTENYQEIEKEKFEKEQNEIKEKEEKKLLENRLKAETQQRELYENLKKKFEDVN